MKKLLPALAVFSIIAVFNAYSDSESLDRMRTYFHEQYAHYGDIADMLAGTFLLENNGTPETDRWVRSPVHQRAGSVDARTVDSELYWEAYFARGWDNPNIYLIRTCLLISEGRLDAAWNTLCFATPAATAAGPEYLQALTGTWRDLYGMYGYLNRLLEAGSVVEELGWSEGIIDNALSVNPMHAPALVSKGRALLEKVGRTNETGSVESAAVAIAAEYYEQARTNNPLCFQAWEYPDELRPIGERVETELEPVLQDIGDGILQHDDIVAFAEGCQAIGAPEFAAYALWIDIGSNREESQRGESVTLLIRTLEEMGMDGAANGIPSRIRLLD